MRDTTGDKPMSPATKELGRKFVLALLEERRDYRSMAIRFREVVALIGMELGDGAANKGAEILGVTGSALLKWLREAGIRRTVVLARTEHGVIAKESA